MKSKQEIEEILRKMDDYRKKHGFPEPAIVSEGFEAEDLDPVTFAVIRARVEGVIRQMADVILRSARNPILYCAKDFTCSILTYDAKLLTMANSIPVHLGSMEPSLAGIIAQNKGDIKPGDAFVNNSPYYGNNHVGDFMVHSPIFYGDEIVAWGSSLCHLMDTGAHVPSNLDPLAADVYQEALHFPIMRIAENYKPHEEFVRFFQSNVRYPDQWYGDYLAQLGSLWIANQEIRKLCDKYGAKVFKAFQIQLLDYGDRLVTDLIKKMPKVEVRGERLSEKVLPIVPDGVMLKVTMWIEPDEGKIYFDYTDMPDQLPWGLNLSYATCICSARQGSLPMFKNAPKNHGVFKHFVVLAREGAVAGMPKWPVGTSVATVGISDQVTGLVMNLWNEISPKFGFAGPGELGGSISSSGGYDYRRDKPYGHMFFIGISGGGAHEGYDGEPIFFGPCISRNMLVESIEVVESSCPLIVWEAGIQTDSGGAGKQEGGVATYHIIQPIKHTLTLVPFGTGHTSPPKGLRGGKDGSLCDHYSRKHEGLSFATDRSWADKSRMTTQFFNAGLFEVHQDEEWVALSNGGGGYGDPLERDPEVVAMAATDYIVSVEGAKENYGVILKKDDPDEEFWKVDWDATQTLRQKMKQDREKN